MGSILPLSRTTLFLQPDGTFTDTSTGVQGESAVVTPITDLVCMDDLDPNGSETTSDLQAFVQDCYHVLLETLGANLADPTRGAGVENVLSGSDAQVLALPAIIDRQLETDDRCQSSTTTLTKNAPGDWSMLVSILPAGSILPIQFSYSNATGLQLVPT